MPKNRALCACACAALASTSLGQVIDTAVGTVEFIGLNTTTPQQAMDPLVKEAKGGRPHACAASFIKAGFPDASVEMLAPDRPSRWLVRLVEPAERERIQRRASPTTPCTIPAAWKPLRTELDAPSIAFQVAMNWLGTASSDTSPGRANTLKAAAVAFGDELPYDPAEVISAWNLIRSFSRPADLELALWVVHHDRDPGNRAAGACILANFPDSDLAYWELVDALLDEHAIVNDFAQRSLKALTTHKPRAVEWGPALASIRRLLDGTNLFAFDTVVQTLISTAVSPEYAPQLLAGGGTMLLASARATDPITRDRATRLLAHLRGGEPGPDANVYDAWVRSLGQTR